MPHIQGVVFADERNAFALYAFGAFGIKYNLAHLNNDLTAPPVKKV